MKFTAHLEYLELKEKFTISQGETQQKSNCIVELQDALGECCPSVYYGYSAENCLQTINSSNIEIDELLEISQTLIEFGQKYKNQKSLLAGLDMALYDYISKKLELPLYQYLGIPAPVDLETSYTISIVTPSELPDKLKHAEGFKSIKLKIGSEYDRENLEYIKSLGKYKIRVDANSAFSWEQMQELIPLLNAMPIELVEQPLQDSDPVKLGLLRNQLNAPIFLDESIVEVEDIFKYVGCIDGINIKLQRVGGIRPALIMIQTAKSVGMKIMLGCMLETSIGNTATAHLGGLADFLDLDSSILLKHDPFNGMTVDRGRINLPSNRTGIGVRRRTDA